MNVKEKESMGAVFASPGYCFKETTLTKGSPGLLQVGFSKQREYCNYEIKTDTIILGIILGHMHFFSSQTVQQIFFTFVSL
jgi:hypothetical protein